MQVTCSVRYLALLWLLVVETDGALYRCYNEGHYGSSIAKFSRVTVESSVMPQFQCDYHYNIQFVVFENSTLEELPKQLFDTFKHLNNANLTRTGIRHVNRYSLENAGTLAVLDLSYNALSELTGNGFSGAVSLSKLILSYNSISSIDSTAFNALTNLMTLLLTGNKLQSLDGTVFRPLAALRTIYLDSNELQVIEADLFSSNTMLENVLLHGNRISVVADGAIGTQSNQPLSILSLRNNSLTKLNLQGVKVKRLYLDNNQLEEIYLSPWVESVYAKHNRIAKVLMDSTVATGLVTLDLENNSISSMESLQHLESLESLYLSHNRIGPLNLTSLAKFTKLQHLGLERTFVSNLQHGTFAQQESLRWLDLSNNNLDRFDFDILTSSAALEKIYLDGNRLKSLDFQHLRKTFPSLVEIGLSDNNWNCTYLIQLVRYCTEHTIALFKPQSSMQNQTNVKGIYCYDDKNPLASWNRTEQRMQLLHPHNNTSDDGALQTLLQSVLDDVRRFSENNADVANQTTRLDGAVYDLTKNQFTMQKDINGLRQTLIDIQHALLANRTNGSIGVTNDELRRMIETVNNLTLNKQELSAKTLEFKIYEQSFKVDKALELGKENGDKVALLAKRVEQWIGNMVASGGGGVSLLTQDRHQQLAQQTGAAPGSGGDHGLIIALLVMMCLLMGVIVLGFLKFHRRLFNVERKRFTNRNSSLSTIVDNDI